MLHNLQGFHALVMFFLALVLYANGYILCPWNDAKMMSWIVLSSEASPTKPGRWGRHSISSGNDTTFLGINTSGLWG